MRSVEDCTLVTGAAGFVGSHLCDSLLARGEQVIGLDNFLTGRPQNLRHLEAHPRFDFVQADVAHGLRANRPIHRIYHLASPASPLRYLRHPLETLRANSEGTRQMLELAQREQATLLLASTSEVYGDPEQHPQHETYWGHVNPVGPRSVYDEAKRYAEALATAYQRCRGVDVRIVRIFNTYGPRMAPEDGRVVSTFIRQALEGEALTIFGNGFQTRSFCYVDDLVEGLMLAMESDYKDPVNLGCPEETTIEQLADRIIAMTGGRSQKIYCPLPEDDPTRRKPDIHTASTKLGWRPRTPLEAGLSRTVRHFAQHENHRAVV